MFVWIFFFLVIVVALIIMNTMRERRRPTTRLNNQGLPRPFERDDHRHKEEE